MSHHFATYWPLVPGPKISTALYDEAAQAVLDGDIVIETGCGFGKGVHYFMEAFQALGKHPKLFAFDTFGEPYPGHEWWEGQPAFTPWNEPFERWAARVGGTTRMLDHFAFHLKNSPAREYLTDWAQLPWWPTPEEFKDETVSFVIANATHTAKGVTRELDMWWPKLKPGGRIGVYGHDEADWGIKRRAVQDWCAFMTDAQLSGNIKLGSNHIILTHP